MHLGQVGRTEMESDWMLRVCLLVTHARSCLLYFFCAKYASFSFGKGNCPQDFEDVYAMYMWGAFQH